MINGECVTKIFDFYLIPTIKDAPLKMNVEAIEAVEQNDCYGPRGVGEIGTVAVAPAIKKAIHDAIGYWVTRLPVSPEELLENAGLLNGRRKNRLNRTQVRCFKPLDV